MGRIINNIVLTAVLTLVTSVVSAQVPQIEKYVAEWAPTAVREMESCYVFLPPKAARSPARL